MTWKREHLTIPMHADVFRQTLNYKLESVYAKKALIYCIARKQQFGISVFVRTSDDDLSIPYRKWFIEGNHGNI